MCAHVCIWTFYSVSTLVVPVHACCPQGSAWKYLQTAFTDGLPCIAVGGLVNALVAMLRSMCENRVRTGVVCPLWCIAATTTTTQALRFVMRLVEKYINWVSTYALLYAGMTGVCDGVPKLAWCL